MHGTIGTLTPVVAPQTTEPALPQFKPRWWYRPDRLDARPVAWSLRNHPEEWEWNHRNYTIEHVPSRHVFWVANGWGFYRLYEANCGCSSTGGAFQRFQQGAFGRAFKRWRKLYGAPPPVDEQFASHFIH